MIKRIKNHILTLPQKVELLVLYGAVMFALGIGLNYLSSPDYPDYYDIEEEGIPIEEVADFDRDYVAPKQGISFNQESVDIKLSELPAELPEKGVYDVVPKVKKSDAALPTQEAEDKKYEKNQDVVKLLKEIEIPEVSDNQHLLDQTLKSIESAPKQSEYVYDYAVEKGDTLTNLLIKAGVNRDEVFFIGKAVDKVYDSRNIKVGQKISITLREKNIDDDGGELEFALLRIFLPEKTLHIVSQGGGKYQASEEKKPLNKTFVFKKGKIETSLFALGNKLKIPANLMVEFMRQYSFDVDFQRDIREGNMFEILYEVYRDGDGKGVKYGNLVYGLLTVDNSNLKIYRYSVSNNDEDADYYTETGQTLRRGLLKTPISGAVISSPFGKRKHPIMGYTKMHKGVDFAADRGTPFYASGDGKIVFIGRKGGYGNYIRIRHSADYETAYGHIYKFAKGMRKGRKVKQGQIIAYVGSTGKSTGPHLHYEILKNGKQVNPMKVKLPAGKKLKSKDLDKFIIYKSEIEKILATKK